jgi:hypothetical protein
MVLIWGRDLNVSLKLNNRSCMNLVVSLHSSIMAERGEVGDEILDPL